MSEAAFPSFVPAAGFRTLTVPGGRRPRVFGRQEPALAAGTGWKGAPCRGRGRCRRSPPVGESCFSVPFEVSVRSSAALGIPEVFPFLPRGKRSPQRGSAVPKVGRPVSSVTRDPRAFRGPRGPAMPPPCCRSPCARSPASGPWASRPLTPTALARLPPSRPPGAGRAPLPPSTGFSVRPLPACVR